MDNVYKFDEIIGLNFNQNIYTCTNILFVDIIFRENIFVQESFKYRDTKEISYIILINNIMSINRFSSFDFPAKNLKHLNEKKKSPL